MSKRTPSSPLRDPTPSEKSSSVHSEESINANAFHGIHGQDNTRLRNEQNRAAASHLRSVLSGKTDKQSHTRTRSEDLGTLPDVGQLSIAANSSIRLRSDRDTDMSKPVTFHGKPSQLAPCLTYAYVKTLADGTTDERQKSGFLASLMRGPALNWLTSKLASSPDFLDDYDEFQEQLKAAFSIDDDAKKLQAARALTGLHQKGSVNDYALRFHDLATAAELNEQTKTALFIKGLKPKIRESLIISDQSETYDETVKEATRLDSNLYYAGHRSTQARKDGKQRRGTDGKFKSNTFKREEY